MLQEKRFQNFNAFPVLGKITVNGTILLFHALVIHVLSFYSLQGEVEAKGKTKNWLPTENTKNWIVVAEGKK